MSACRELEVLVSLRAAAALEPDEELRVDAHLRVCASCRDEADRAAEVIGLARLPAATERERSAIHAVPDRALLRLHRREARRGAGKRYLAAGAAIVAAAAIVLAPGLIRHPAPVAPAVAVEPAGWQAPDLDALWEDAAVVDLDGGALASDGRDAALAALEAGWGG